MDRPLDRGPLTLRTGTPRAGDARLSAPAVQLNRAPILEVLNDILPRRGTVLEIGSGTGEHAAYMAAHLPDIVWQPSERADASLASIAAWRAGPRLEEPKSALQFLMRLSYA